MIPRLPSDFLTKPLAHRGLHDVSDGCPENSRSAIDRAISSGYGIEIDLQISADNMPLVFHDYSLNRLTHEKGMLRQLDASELTKINLIGNHESIPDLAEILDLVQGRAPLLIEFKDQDGNMGPNIGPLEKAAANLLQEYQGPLAVMSFNPHSVALLADLLPNVARGLVTSSYDPDEWPLSTEICDHLRQIPDYQRTRASFISHEVDDLERDRVRELKSQGADLLCWTVKSAAQEQKARKLAQNITFEQYLAEIR